eukprot:TRINITY_DN63136_c0_g1_i1.p1 TRINITY_DN63136_c0_g1~~TRINITY_DN63136_c0_g1_i1.p1  ORF type:complete len:531 (+),score=84.31 TRINITY_DN63136_c0_g1_i1:90-1682(+)
MPSSNAELTAAFRDEKLIDNLTVRKQFLFVSGASGSGKTSICNVLTENGYKIFDADIWCAGGDPINQVDAAVTPAMVASRDPAMAKAVTDAIALGRTQMGKGESVPWQVWETFYTFMCSALNHQTAQNGHDKWVIPFAVYREVERDFIRKSLGDDGDVTFVLLNVPEEILGERVHMRTEKKAKEQGLTLEEYMGRFQPGKTVQEVFDTWKLRRSGFEVKGMSEPETFQIDVSREMTPAMVHLKAERLLGLPGWFFATGSSMNPTLLEGRKLNAVESMPAKLMDFKLEFHGVSAFACNVPEKGASTHGVLHLMSQESMEQIDQEERGYDRLAGTATTYDGRTITCTVYVVNLNNLSSEEAEQITRSKPPSERYIDRLVEGAQHYGCAPEFITWLQAQPCIPRKPVNELISLSTAGVSATWSLQDLEKHKNPEEGKPWCLGLNGKVLQYIGPADGKARTRRAMSWAGVDVTMQMAIELYDPKYGMPKTPADVSPELALRQEDKFIEVWGGLEAFQTMFKMVAHLETCGRDIP